LAKQTEPQCVLERLQDAVVKDVRLDGLDLVFQVSMPAVTKGRATRQGTSCRLASRPFELVFKEFHGLVPWRIKGRTLGLLEEKDGVYLLGTDNLEDHVLWARSLCLRLSPSPEAGNPQSPEGIKP